MSTTTTPKTEKNEKIINDNEDCDSGGGGGGPGGGGNLHSAHTSPNLQTGGHNSSTLRHKGSLRGNKLARRARSFKDDLFEKLSQMRTPNSTMTRSHSPHTPRGPHIRSAHKDNHNQEVPKPVHDLNYHVRLVKHALTHFKDVIFKNKLEMLSGNGTVVLESIASVLTTIQSYQLNEHSTVVISATQQVHLAVGNLLKLCDEVTISADGEDCACLNHDNVKEVVDLVDNAVQNLVKLVNEKIAERESHSSVINTSSNTLQRPTIDVAGQRTSLPDIPLTPRERDILEQTSMKSVRASHSTESILRDSSPPPKPPLPNRTSEPPPLPPKRKSQNGKNGQDMDNDTLSSPFLGCASSDRTSLRSRSPEDNSSLLSVSAGSLDSALNHSREEDDSCNNHIDEQKDNSANHGSIQIWDESDNVQTVPSIANCHRNSNESGLGSMYSLRSSVQSIHTSKQHSSSYSIQQKMNSLDGITEITHQASSKSFLAKQEVISSASSSSSELSKTISTTSSNRTFTSKSMAFGSTQFGSIDGNDEVFGSVTNDLDKPPALPVKTRGRSIRRERQQSHYDNVEDSSSDQLGSLDQFPSHCIIPNGRFLHTNLSFSHANKTISCIEPRTINQLSSEKPPPLPMKKKHIMAYMEIFGNATHSSEFLRHSVHSCNTTHTSEHVSHSISHSQTMSLSPSRIKVISPPSSPNLNIKPPALPPKRQRVNSIRGPNDSISSTPPPSPKVFHDPIISSSSPSPSPSNGSMTLVQMQQPKIIQNCQNDQLKWQENGCKIKVSSADVDENDENNICTINNNSNNNNNNNSKSKYDYQHVCNATSSVVINNINNTVDNNNVSLVKNNHNNSSSDHKNSSKNASADDDDDEVEVVLRRRDKNGEVVNKEIANLMDELDLTNFLVFKKENEDGPDIKGGHPDALIIHATRVQKKSDAYGEAFITTFRTFITPQQLIEKLVYRYNLFNCQNQDQKQKAAKESFSLLVRVVNDLTAPDLNKYLLEFLMDFEYQLVCNGQLTMAKLLRVKILEKAKIFKIKPQSVALSSLAVTTNIPSLLELKSSEIAEQMTLLDAELFHKIEIPEVLIWAQEQREDLSPNLTLFTEHFNKMSYWARSQILLADAKDREKHVIKFIKIMKHLRKINNYNSYLALLSALDSAPIRRLEWHKTITDGLKEYCALIDSSSSFRAYRQALAETSPPCIPYIGLVLQDLTFVHIGNPDLLPEGSINFSKRWQQYNIVVNMKRFKKGSYPYKKSERIIGFFNDFENYLDEDAMWQISENIKPRGGRKLNAN